MGHKSKKKGGNQSGGSAALPTGPTDLHESANMVDRVTNDVEQEILRQGLHVPLVIFDSKAMYEEVFQLKATDCL